MSIRDIVGIVCDVVLGGYVGYAVHTTQRFRKDLAALANEVRVSFDQVYGKVVEIDNALYEDECEVDTSALAPVDDSFARYVGAPPPPADAWLDYDGSSDATRMQRAVKMLRERRAAYEAERRVREAEESAVIYDARTALHYWHEARRAS